MVDDDRGTIGSEVEIERTTTGIRLLYTLLFCAVLQLVEFVLALVVIFGLIYAFVTTREPSRGVRDFADRVLRYAYEIVEYLTWNREQVPFPFDELPAEREAGAATN